MTGKSALMTAAPNPTFSPRCHDLLSLAAFEVHAGYVGTAQAYMDAVQRCRQTGCCAAPNVCGSKREPDAGKSAAIIRFPNAARADGAGDGVPSAGATLTPLARPVRQTDASGNQVERRSLSPAMLRLRGGSLAELLAYWQQLRVLGSGTLADLDSIRLLKMGLLGWLHLVDVAAPDPDKFWLPICGWRVPIPYLDRSRNGVRFDEYPVRLLARAVTRDYLEVRTSGMPIYQHFRSRISGRAYNYLRLILPMSTDGTRTDRLLVAMDFGAS